MVNGLLALVFILCVFITWEGGKEHGRAQGKEIGYREGYNVGRSIGEREWDTD